MAEEQQGKLTVDGKEYDTATLSDNAKNIIRNIQFADQELNRQRMALTAMQTARQAYVGALKNELDGDGNGAAEAAE